ncbi:DUF167 family protein [Gallaecimonas sp. GXIMD1310]|uniref:DUF167 family protein n=1 Tax=Gallaecimonas sp. GXIMD1310 TaxID=3131926 RepID=UPI0032470C59
MAAFSWQGADLLLQLYVQPKASRNAFAGIHGDELKLAITAPPVDGKANEHIRKWLAKQCKVAKTQVLIEQGQLSRHKRVRVQCPARLPDDWDWLTEPQGA